MDPCKYGFGRPRNAVPLMVYPYLDWAAIWSDSGASRVLQDPRKYLPGVPEIVPDPPVRSAQIILVLRVEADEKKVNKIFSG